MIRVGCAVAHPEDASFFSSEAFIKWALHNPQWEFSQFPWPSNGASADVWLLPANNLDKHWAAPALQAASWVMVSSKRSDALAAWQMGAAYFLLRPFTLSQLQTAIERAQICHSWKNGHAGRQAPSGNGLELVLIKGRKFQVQHSDILFLEARGEVTVVHLRGVGREKLTATRNLGFWETQLADADFIRVHKKFLVNLFHISSLIDCELQVQQYRIPVAKRRRKDVENVLFRHEMLQRRSAAE